MFVTFGDIRDCSHWILFASRALPSDGRNKYLTLLDIIFDPNRKATPLGIALNPKSKIQNLKYRKVLIRNRSIGAFELAGDFFR